MCGEDLFQAMPVGDIPAGAFPADWIPAAATWAVEYACRCGGGASFAFFASQEEAQAVVWEWQKERARWMAEVLRLNQEARIAAEQQRERDHRRAVARARALAIFLIVAGIALLLMRLFG